MKKYFSFFWLEIKQMSEFKLDFFLFWVESLFKACIIFCFWFTLWQGAEGNSFSSMDRHTFLSMVIYCQILLLPMRNADQISSAIEENVISGNMAAVLCRPIHPIYMYMSKCLCQQLRLCLLSTSILLIASYYFSPTPPLFFNSIQQGFLFLCSLLLGLLIHYFFYIGLGLASFWIGHVWSILYVSMIVSGFTSGQMFPLGMKPAIDFWSQFLPFRYFAYSPATIFYGLNGFNELLKQGIMLITLVILVNIVYKVALKKFEASGG